MKTYTTPKLELNLLRQAPVFTTSDETDLIDPYGEEADSDQA